MNDIKAVKEMNRERLVYYKLLINRQVFLLKHSLATDQLKLTIHVLTYVEYAEKQKLHLERCSLHLNFILIQRSVLCQQFK